jgi:hypothetical protein
MVQENDLPNKSWTLEKLQGYALDRADQISSFGRKTIIHTWLFGASLACIQEIKKENRTWIDWLKSQPFSPTTAANAIKLYEKVRIEDLSRFDGMTVSDLKVMLDIIKRPPSKRQEEAPAPTSPARVGRTAAATAKKCGKKVAPHSHLKVVAGDSPVEEQTDTDETDLDQPQDSAPPETSATEPEAPPSTSSAHPQSPTSTTTPILALEYLHKINVKLEELERDLKGVKPDNHFIAMIDLAIGTLQRLRTAVADVA